MSVPFWIVNLSQQRLDAMEARWASALTQAQLANPWQQVRLDGQALPGLWSLRKVKRKITAQANKKSGSDGGSATLRGLVNPNFELRGQLFIPSHLDAWIKLVPSLDVTGKPDQRSQHNIEHPLCTLTGVRSVLVLELEYQAPEQGAPLGIALGLLGYGQKDGQTKKPKAKPVGTKDVPTVDIGRSAPAPSLRQVRPPEPAR